MGEDLLVHAQATVSGLMSVGWLQALSFHSLTLIAGDWSLFSLSPLGLVHTACFDM